MSPTRPLGDWREGGSRGPETGSNRLLVVVSNVVGASCGCVGTSATYGGRAMTLIDSSISYGVYGAATTVWALDEAGIAGASGSSIATTWSGNVYAERIVSAFFASVDQRDPTSIPVQGSTDSSTPNPLTAPALSSAAGDYLLVAGAGQGVGSFTPQSGFTEHVDNFFDDGDADAMTYTVVGRASTGADEIPAVEHLGLSSAHLIAFSIRRR